MTDPYVYLSTRRRAHHLGLLDGWCAGVVCGLGAGFLASHPTCRGGTMALVFRVDPTVKQLEAWSAVMDRLDIRYSWVPPRELRLVDGDHPNVPSLLEAMASMGFLCVASPARERLAE